MTPVAIHAWGGGQVDADSHGDVTVGVRGGDLRAELLTDTLELAWEPEGDHGRAWVSARANAFSAGLFISPWADGAPDPDRALRVAYGGVEAGAIHYLPAGLWAGGRVWGRWHSFALYGENDGVAPPDHPVVRGDALLGLHRPGLSGELRLGAHVEPEAEALGGKQFQPHVELEGHWRPQLVVAPVVDGWATWADGQSALTRARVGGLTPYVVPLAGAAWAEWWVEDHVVGRAGFAAGATHLEEIRPKVRGRAELTADVAALGPAWADADAPDFAVGFRGAGHVTWRRLYTDLAVGVAPWIPRAADVGRVSAFFRVGLDWAPVTGRAGVDKD